MGACLATPSVQRELVKAFFPAVMRTQSHLDGASGLQVALGQLLWLDTMRRNYSFLFVRELVDAFLVHPHFCVRVPYVLYV